MSEAIKAYEGESNPRTTIYEFADGRKEKWIGGSKAWRNNNPGNLMPAKAHPNQIGKAWEMAVFPTRAAGENAMFAQLRRPLYYALTLEAAIYQYAPPKFNPTEKYIQFVSSKSGVSRKTKLSDLSDDELRSLTHKMMTFERTVEGKVEVIAPVKTGRYIWHTAEDEKVRPEHAVRDGKVFDYANPPPGGNPGEAYNCRCWGELLPDRDLREIFKK